MKSYIFEKSFASHPKSQYWNYEFNDNINPRNISLNSMTKYWFNCDKCLHKIHLIPNSVNVKNSWCPYCSNNKLCKNNDCKDCFDKSFASNDNSIYWNYQLNENINPRMVFKGNNNKDWYFDCKDCLHTFATKLLTIKNGSWCSYCSNKILCDNNECKYCFNKSLAFCSKSKLWNYDLNKNINPRMVFLGQNNKKYYFTCNECNHNFNITPLDIKNNKFCGYCTSKKLCDKEKKCKICFDKTIASKEFSKFWNFEKITILSQKWYL